MRRAAFILCVLTFLAALAPAGPGAFSKLSPANQSVGHPPSLTLRWNESSNAARYEICISANDPPLCNEPWLSAGTGTSFAATNLSSATLYFWQVRAVGADGSLTYADGPTTFWSFTVAAAPGMFVKTAPYDGESGVSTSPVLTWGASSGALKYEYCYDDSDDDACALWIDAGLQRSAALDGLIAKTGYYWQVRASGVGGVTYANTGPGDYWHFVTQSTPPGGFVKTGPPNGASSVSLTPSLAWSASSGVREYKYCLDTSDDNRCDTWISVGTQTVISLTQRLPGATYYWQVQAVSPGGTTYANASAFDFWAFTTLPAPPGAFALIAPANGAANQLVSLNLAWQLSQGAESYEYCLALHSDQPCTAWVSVGALPQAALSELNYATTYYWQARARGPGGVTYAGDGPAFFWHFTTQAAPPGPFQKSLPAHQSEGVSTSPTLRWSASAGAERYEYCFYAAGGCAGWIDAGAALSVTPDGLSPATAYFWQARAIGPGGLVYADDSPGAFWRFTTRPASLNAFQKSAPAHQAVEVGLSPSLRWSASQGASGYAYCFDASDDNACAVWIEAGNTLSVTLNGLAPATVYFWQARAHDASGLIYADGDPAAFWRFTTRSDPPQAFAKSAPANAALQVSTHPRLQWQPSPGASAYAYCYDTSNDGACSPWIEAGEAVSVTPDGLHPAVTYYWQVRASGAGGLTYADGGPGAFWHFTTAAASTPDEHMLYLPLILGMR